MIELVTVAVLFEAGFLATVLVTGLALGTVMAVTHAVVDRINRVRQ